MFFESLVEWSLGFTYACVAAVDVTRDVIDGSTLLLFQVRRVQTAGASRSERHEHHRDVALREQPSLHVRRHPQRPTRPSHLPRLASPGLRGGTPAQRVDDVRPSPGEDATQTDVPRRRDRGR